MVRMEFTSPRVATFASFVLKDETPMGIEETLWIKIKAVAASVLSQAPNKLLTCKVTSEKVASFASEIERMNKPYFTDVYLWQEIKSIAGSALTQAPDTLTAAHFGIANAGAIGLAKHKFSIEREYAKNNEPISIALKAAEILARINKSK